MKATPEQLVKAHQYLYYVLCRPVLSDYEYDMYCRKHGIPGGGGSDFAGDYSTETVQLAMSLLR